MELPGVLLRLEDVDRQENYQAMKLQEKISSDVEDLEREIDVYAKHIKYATENMHDAMKRRDVLVRVGAVLSRSAERQAKEEAEQKAKAEAERKDNEEAKAQKTPAKVNWARKRPRSDNSNEDSNE